MTTSQTAMLSSSTPTPGARPAAASAQGQILKSSVLIGGSSVFTIVFGMVRTKVMALILGPAGVGVFGLFLALYELARNVSVMGLNTSGVRQIAEASAAGNAKQIAVTVTALRRITALFAVVGAVLMVALCVPISWLSFNKDTSNAIGVAILGGAILCGTLSAGQIALLQGTRRIGQMANANVIGGFIGTIGCLGVVLFLREKGIALALVAIYFGAMLGSWWYSRQVKVEPVTLSWKQVFQETSGLLRLGVVFMLVGLMGLGVPYLIRIKVLEELGKEAAGFYQSAWMLGGLYVGVVLQAMGADFLPRLTAAAKDNTQCNRLVNEQAEISLLLAGPGIMGTLTFAGLVIHVFYSAKFDPAVEILPWFCLGMILRVASWPMSFILLAKGARRAYFWTELATCLLQWGLTWVCVEYLGLEGAGIAFFVSYVIYWVLIFMVVKSVSGFAWNHDNKRIGALYVGLIAAAFFASYYLDAYQINLFDLKVFGRVLHMQIGYGVIVGSLFTVSAGIYSMRKVLTLMPVERFPKPAQRLLVLFRLAAPGKSPTAA